MSSSSVPVLNTPCTTRSQHDAEVHANKLQSCGEYAADAMVRRLADEIIGSVADSRWRLLKLQHIVLFLRHLSGTTLNEAVATRAVKRARP